MIHFHHETTFQVLTSFLILTRSWTQDRISLHAQLVEEEPMLASTIPQIAVPPEYILRFSSFSAPVHLQAEYCFSCLSLHRSVTFLSDYFAGQILNSTHHVYNVQIFLYFESTLYFRLVLNW
jgi:hypothetical protein